VRLISASDKSLSRMQDPAVHSLHALLVLYIIDFFMLTGT